MAAEIKYRVNNSNDVWLTDDVYRWNLPNTTLSMLWVDVMADGNISSVEQKNEDWCRFMGRDDKGDFYRYWFTFINNSGYERRNEYEFSTTVGDETASFTLKIIQKGTLQTPTTAESLNRIIQAKNGIKQAIENKGVTVGNMTIDGYAAKIAEIEQNSDKWIVPNGTKFQNSAWKTFDGNTVDVSNVEDLNYMFYDCSSLTSVDLSSWDVSNVETLNNMFQGCINLQTIVGLENWVTPNLKYISMMFQNCQSLTSVDLSSFNTSKVESFSSLFSYCKSLTSVDLTNWDLSRVADMNQMFAYCENLTEVKMGGNPQRLSAVAQMFLGVTTTGTFYYNSQYDYSKIIAKLPSTWTAVPMG